MWWKIWELAVTILDCVLIVFFLTSYLPLKKKTIWIYIVSVIFLAGICSISGAYCDMLGSFFILTLTLFFYLLFFVKGTIPQKVFWTLFCQLVFFGVDICQNALVSALVGNTTPSDFIAPGSLRLFNMIFSRFIIVCIIIIISKHKFFSAGLTNSQTILLCLCPIISCLAMSFLIKDFYTGGIGGKQIIWNCILICVVNLIIFCLFRSLSLQRDMLREKELELQKAELEDAQYKQIFESSEKLRIWKHDIHNHLTSIISLAKESGAQNVIDYISDLNTDIICDSHIVVTGNAIVDAVLNSKLSYATKVSIAVDLDISIPEFACISDAELCSIIGNVLDNAIEANLKVQIPKRYIHLEIMAHDHFGLIYCENASLPVDDNLPTTKSGLDHGIGIKRIKQLIDKYQGIYCFRPGNGTFSVKLLLPIKSVCTKPALLWNSEGMKEYAESNGAKIHTV
ncbi:MAG: ATP-binding protein [Oscillospiraceae bacterium]